MIYRLDNFTEHALNPVTGQAWDGSEMKVRDALPLATYLLWAATPAALGMASTSTPHAFAQAADVQFQRRVKPDDQSAHQH